MNEKQQKAKEQGEQIKAKIENFANMIKGVAEKLATIYKEVKKHG